MNPHHIALGNEDSSLFRDVFRRACSHLPSGVAIVAGLDAEEPFGLTVSSVTAVSSEPSLLFFCVSRASARVKQLRRVTRFSVNILGQAQGALATRFAAPGVQRFEGIAWSAHSFGAPMLRDVVGVLLCELRSELAAGDHQLLIGEVKEIVLHGGDPLVYWRRAFHRLHLWYPFLESETALDDFVSRWKLGTLPKPSWTHGAHVAVAAYLAFDHTAEETLNLTRAGIVHFNTCVGTPNTEDNGYHETLTRFWSGQVGNLVRGGRFASRLEAVRHAIQQFGEDRDRHRLFYSFDVVKDRRARREWVAPDRSPTKQAPIETTMADCVRAR
jgi:flavin reductase (DIM6/NTAB) family NADH-FMN oxidoreductase RutF